MTEEKVADKAANAKRIIGMLALSASSITPLLANADEAAGKVQGIEAIGLGLVDGAVALCGVLLMLWSLVGPKVAALSAASVGHPWRDPYLIVGLAAAGMVTSTGSTMGSGIIWVIVVLIANIFHQAATATQG